jgi:hypothetical protein
MGFQGQRKHRASHIGWILQGYALLLAAAFTSNVARRLTLLRRTFSICHSIAGFLEDVVLKSHDD